MFPGMAPTKGRLLVATPPLDDPHFDRTVVFMLEHHDDGALGVVLNRPERRVARRAARRVDRPCSRAPPPVFSGGPVEADALIALAARDGRLDEDDEHLAPLTATIASADLSADPATWSPQHQGLRVFRGYAGWGPGQLEDEIEAGVVAGARLRRPTTCSPPSPTSSGAPCCAVSPAGSAWLADAPDDLGWN